MGQSGMMHIYALVMISLSNPSEVSTVRYFDNHSDCRVQMHELADNNKSHMFDCWVTRGDIIK